MASFGRAAQVRSISAVCVGRVGVSSQDATRLLTSVAATISGRISEISARLTGTHAGAACHSFNDTDFVNSNAKWSQGMATICVAMATLVDPLWATSQDCAKFIHFPLKLYRTSTRMRNWDAWDRHSSRALQSGQLPPRAEEESIADRDLGME